MPATVLCSRLILELGIKSVPVCGYSVIIIVMVLRKTPAGLLLGLALFCQVATALARPPGAAEPRAFNPLPKRSLDYAKLGTNAFVNDQRFGSIKNQYLEVKNTLKLRYVRSLFAWNDQVQPKAGGPIDWSFYDQIARSIPRGLNVMVVLTGVPSWMSDSRNWIEGNPRKTFVELWLKPVIKRYRRFSAISAWQVWNEPNDENNPNNRIIAVLDSPSGYVEMLGLASSAKRAISPKRRLVVAATTAINQNFPETLDYNRALQQAGAENFLDIWAIHYYGYQIENVLFPGGISDFCSGLKKPIWVTESGEKGVNQQLGYAQRLWPFLLQFIPKIERIYQYQFTEATPANDTYGLRNLTPGFTVSDLYINLRDRK
jgi:hypothetical protein